MLINHNLIFIIIISKEIGTKCQPNWKVNNIKNQGNKFQIVDYWRRRYQRMNSESFVAANVMALVTHTLV